jgi:hypothetical protein
MDEQSDVIGFLGSNGTLYCSKGCALRHGIGGDEVDQDDLESLVEDESIEPGILCPVCGSEFPVSWPDSRPN